MADPPTRNEATMGLHQRDGRRNRRLRTMLVLGGVAAAFVSTTVNSGVALAATSAAPPEVTIATDRNVTSRPAVGPGTSGGQPPPVSQLQFRPEKPPVDLPPGRPGGRLTGLPPPGELGSRRRRACQARRRARRR